MAATVVADAAPAEFPEAARLPPVDTLTFESDYSAFMQPKVAEETKRAALRKLFSAPSFNVMDGLDIYVGDYTQSDPMPSGMLEKLSKVYAMLDPVEPAPEERAAAGNPPQLANVAPGAEPGVPAEIAADSPSAAELSATDTADAGDASATSKPA